VWCNSTPLVDIHFIAKNMKSVVYCDGDIISSSEGVLRCFKSPLPLSLPAFFFSLWVFELHPTAKPSCNTCRSCWWLVLSDIAPRSSKWRSNDSIRSWHHLYIPASHCVDVVTLWCLCCTFPFMWGAFKGIASNNIRYQFYGSHHKYEKKIGKISQ